MRGVLVTACLAAALLAAGCATKKYVRNTVAPVQARVEQVGEQTSRNAQAIEETRGQVKQVDARAEAGISAAGERAASADQHAATADQHAANAMTRASEALESANKVSRDLRQLVSNIDDYQPQSSASVLFKFNQSVLTADAKRQLDDLAVGAKSHSRLLITVEGFTDNVGAAKYNEALSQRRADAVVRYLVTRWDIPIYRIHVVGLGTEKPVSTARTAAARAQNRRVEVRVFSGDGIEAALNGHSENSASRSAVEPPAPTPNQ
ncbi:MAG: flagellar motor protein MotB [Terriglobia bacterium]|nr:MAG: flagellar motor protein MotB [Terriglobia bacterium]